MGDGPSDVKIIPSHGRMCNRLSATRVRTRYFVYKRDAV